jgi:DNA-binding NtrC family response regulator
MKNNLKILILEDNSSDVNLVLHELRKAEFNFTSAVVQTQAGFENALQRFIPDIILSDYSLPSFDGVTAFHIKQNTIPDIPFIIISGTIGEENAVELIKNGVTDYVLKDKLFTLATKITRALKDVEEKKEKTITDKKLKAQHDQLFEIAFLQSHQVRGPLTNILGLFSLFKFDNPSDPLNGEIICKLKIVAESFDKVIHDILEKTSEIKHTIKNNSY